MSPRLLYLLSIEHAPCERDRIDFLAAAARMTGRREPRWTRNALLLV